MYHPKRFLFRTLLVCLFIALVISCSDNKSNGTQNGGSGTIGGGTSTGSGAGTGTGTVEGVPYAGEGSQLPTGEESAAIQQAGEEVAEIAPTMNAGYPPGTGSTYSAIIQAEAAGQSTAQMRMEMAGEFMAYCQSVIQPLQPWPGEPYIGNFVAVCTDSGELTYGSITATYPQVQSGYPTGQPALFSTAIDEHGEHYSVARVQVDSSTGKGYGYAIGNYGTYYFEITDQPDGSPFSGYGYLVDGGSGGCETVYIQQTTSRNPIPEKHDEAMSLLYQCYMTAITMVSPILSDYMYNLSSSSAYNIMITFHLP